MKYVSVMSLAAVVTMTSAASAATVWNPAANPDQTPPFNWNDPLNWTNDVPGVIDGKAVLNVTGAAEAIITDEQVTHQWVLGDNGDGGVLRVQAGGSLSGDGNPVWSAVGYNNFAHLIVEEGGTVNFSEHMWVAFAPDTGFFIGEEPIVDVNGGTITVGGMFGIGWEIDPDGVRERGIGFVNVNDGGLLALSNIHADGSRSIAPNSLLTINGTGRVTLPGDFRGVIAEYAANGLIAGNGVVGAVQTALEGGGADFDGNGFVDGNDLLVWQQDPGVGDLGDWESTFGEEATELTTVVTALPAAAISAVPEPGASALALAQLLAAYGFRPRPRRRLAPARSGLVWPE